MSSIQRDLGDTFCQRLHQLVVDTVDRCETVDIPMRDSAVMVISILLSELSHATQAAGFSEKTFLTVCQGAYRQAEEIEKTRRKARKANK
jgi:hypothetical protein